MVSNKNIYLNLRHFDPMKIEYNLNKESEWLPFIVI